MQPFQFDDEIFDFFAGDSSKTGFFIDSIPAIRINDSFENCFNAIKSYPTDANLHFKINSLQRILTHEMAHYVQIVGSSYGYLKFLHKNLRNQHMERLLNQFVMKENISQPYFEKLRNKNINSINIHQTLSHDCMVYFLDFYNGGNIENYLIPLQYLRMYWENALVKKRIDLSVKAIKLWKESISNFEKQKNKKGVFSDQRKSNFLEKLLSPKSICENYARFSELISMHPFDDKGFGGIDRVKWNHSIRGEYGYALKAMAPLLQNINLSLIHKVLIVSIFELSLMVAMHPAIVELASKQNHQINIFELTVSHRFFTIYSFFYKNSEFCNDYWDAKINKDMDWQTYKDTIEINLIDFMDKICNKLGWIKYSDNLLALENYYSKILKENNPDENYNFFLNQSKTLLTIKRKHPSVLIHPFQVHIYALKSHKYGFDFICNDGVFSSNFKNDSSEIKRGFELYKQLQIFEGMFCDQFNLSSSFHNIFLDYLPEGSI